jgi:ribosomal protein L37E
MSCPKCGYSGHNTVSHWGTGEVECENCRHDYVPTKKEGKREIQMFDKFKVCPRCNKKTFHILDQRCNSCGHVALFVIPMEMPEPLDMSMFNPPISWAQRVGHAEVPRDTSWERDMEKLKKLFGE